MVEMNKNFLVRILFRANRCGPVRLFHDLMLASSGQTVGKKVMKIKVVTPEGDDIAAS